MKESQQPPATTPPGPISQAPPPELSILEVTLSEVNSTQGRHSHCSSSSSSSSSTNAVEPQALPGASAGALERGEQQAPRGSGGGVLPPVLAGEEPEEEGGRSAREDEGRAGSTRGLGRVGDAGGGEGMREEARQACLEQEDRAKPGATGKREHLV